MQRFGHVHGGGEVELDVVLSSEGRDVVGQRGQPGMIGPKPSGELLVDLRVGVVGGQVGTVRAAGMPSFSAITRAGQFVAS